jgi:putative ABC transport system ATP-binding protein
MLIKTEKLTRVYRTDEIETTSLDSIDLSKSTLLNLIGMLDNPTAGRYYFMNQEVSKFSEKQLASIRKANIGFVFQSFNLIDELSVFENIELPLLYLGLSATERKNKVNEVLTSMEISHRAKHFPQQLSGGQQQRVAVCRAIVSNPKLILADEPTGNLDSKNGEEVMKLLTQLNEKGTTVVMVTHSLAHAQYAKRIINMLDGKIVGTTANKATA